MAWSGGHVNSSVAAADLVAGHRLTEIAATEKDPPVATKKKSFVKSKTCCNFFCDNDNCDGTAEETTTSRPIPIRTTATLRGLQRKKLFPSFSHPDTSFIFTDEEIAQLRSPQGSGRRNWRRRDSELELNFNNNWAVRSGGANSGGVGCGKEFLGERSRVSVLRRRGAADDVEIAGDVGDKQKVDLSDDNRANKRYTIIAVHPEIAVKVRNSPDGKSDNEVAVVKVAATTERASVKRLSQLKVTKSESDASVGGNGAEKGAAEDNATGHRGDSNGEGKTKRAVITLKHSKSESSKAEDSEVADQLVLEAAKKYFQESGIFGPIMGTTLSAFRKSSKVNIIDNHQFEQIRKHSRTIQRVEKPIQIIPSPTTEKCDEELSNLRELLKKRDGEIGRLKREIHKLKSVLQQTAEAPIETDLISRIQTPCPANDQIGNALKNKPAEGRNQEIIPINGKTSEESIALQFNTVFQATIPAPINLHPVTKKQGVSAESSENKQHMLKDIVIEVHEKDFRSKQLIKDAILDNDFLKHLASGQIKKLVESMYRIEIPKGDYVIREGESGDHLYISDDGEFEVIKDNLILGKMGSGKAFGELAILYNCKRTASIRVLSDARVWVLDRRVFQHIMMRTGMETIEENINFLRSVPLLKHLGVDSLAKIADVLELEFYPTGTYIIRQDTSGDSFFLISQGNVKVTQRIPGTKIEEDIRELGRGDYFGEQALIKEDKRTANIIALCPGVECLTLDREAFRKFIGDLSELHDIDYGDEFRATTFKENEQELIGLSKTHNQQLLHIGLSDLEIVATLGVGGFGRVELVKYCSEFGREMRRKVENTEADAEEGNKVETYALKCLKKQHILDTKQEEHVFNERSIMMSCDSKFICRLYRTYRDTKYVYMLLEACLGGEIWTILRNRGNFDEYSGKFIIGCVLEAFQYLHSRGIVYRDLKPENLLLNSNGYVKLVDFGFAKYIGFSSKTWTFCGTPEYVSPEIILNKGHDRAVDYWALGILVFELLTGAPPFTSPDPMKTYNIILKNMMEFPSQMSKTAVNFIKKLCRDVPAERLGYQRGGVQEIKKHKWFQGFDWDGLSIQTLPSPIANSVVSAIDTSNFDCFPLDNDIPPDECSGWDEDF